MAADWLKIEEDMPDKPEVFAIAEQLGIDPDAVAGKLIRVWRWASRSCHGDGVTTSAAKLAIDRASGVSGFAAAMVSAGWLLEEGDKIRFPNFDRHNSQTAKDRGLAFIRKQQQRANGHAPVTEMSRSGRDKNGTKETDANAETESKSAFRCVSKEGVASKPYLLRGSKPKADFMSVQRGREQFRALLQAGHVTVDDEVRVVSLWFCAATKKNPAAWFNAGIEAAIERREWRGTNQTDEVAAKALKARDSPANANPLVQSAVASITERPLA